MSDPRQDNIHRLIVPNTASLRGRGIYLLPNLFTTGALFAGFYAIIAATKGHFEGAAVAILVAIVLDIVKRPEAAGSWQASHFSWRLRSVVYAGIAYVVTLPLWLLVIPGWIAWLLISVWFLYRIVQGWSSLSARRPMPL